MLRDFFFIKNLTLQAGNGLISAVAQIAQSVEQGIENPRVGGSIPSLGTTSLKIKHVLRHALTNILSGSNLIRAQLTSV